MDWTRTDEGTKQKTLNFKLDRNKRGRPQNLKSNARSGDRNWKFKLQKAIKTDQGLKSMMSIMDTEDRTNQDLILALAESNVQLSVPGD